MMNLSGCGILDQSFWDIYFLCTMLVDNHHVTASNQFIAAGKLPIYFFARNAFFLFLFLVFFGSKLNNVIFEF